MKTQTKKKAPSTLYVERVRSVRRTLMRKVDKRNQIADRKSHLAAVARHAESLHTAMRYAMPKDAELREWWAQRWHAVKEILDYAKASSEGQE